MILTPFKIGFPLLEYCKMSKIPGSKEMPARPLCSFLHTSHLNAVELNHILEMFNVKKNKKNPLGCVPTFPRFGDPSTHYYCKYGSVESDLFFTVIPSIGSTHETSLAYGINAGALKGVRSL